MIESKSIPGSLKSSCLITHYMKLPNYSPDQQADMVTYIAHSMKMDLKKQEQNELFSKVLSFLHQFLSSKTVQADIKVHLSKYGKSEHAVKESKNQKQMSFKKMNFGSKICFDAETMGKDEAEWDQGKGRTRGNSKKISIFIMEEEYPQIEFGSDELVSESSLRTIRSIEIPHLEMTLQTIALIFQTPQPFLINLSICLFVRYSLSARYKVKLEESAWVLCVATVIAYKLYYDEEIEGLLDFFRELMGISKKDLVDLERCFLEQIDYNTVIRNYDYHYLLSRLSAMPAQTHK